ncbi:hypothetical protein LCGC14_0396750 [marine sediment metagenome]|uniref:Uncharacterized protein n=1 Tax=marine sediment metagenome TaxID=412755 RepID=A0A0F9W777_9ZZZZ
MGDSLLTVTPTKLCLWATDESGEAKANYDYLHKGRTQDLGLQYRENGAIYIVKRDVLMETKQFIGGKVTLFPISPTCSFDIDNHLDFIVAERVMDEVIANQSQV